MADKPDSAVEQALAQMVLMHRKITQANGYNTNVALVSRHWRDPEGALQSTNLPAIFVMRALGRPNPIEWCDENFMRQRLSVQVLGYVGATGLSADDDDLATRAERLLSDLKQLQMDDPTYGLGPRGLIRNSHMTEDLNDAGWDAGGALVGIAVELSLYYDRSLA